MNSNNKIKNKVSSTSFLYKKLEQYSKPDTRKSILQIINTFLPYIGIWILIFYSFTISYWISAFLIILAAGFLVRLFIIFHDCGHGSFFKSKKANTIIGMLFGILAFTPYYKWHNQHMRHHATVGNLDKRGEGDVWTMTREEYLNANKWKRFKYRIYRNPFVFFGIGSLFLFLVMNRLTKKGMDRKERMNVYYTNLILISIFIVMGSIIGFGTYLIVQLSILYIASMIGLWLFYLQHQYENVNWFRNSEWDFQTVALSGSSFLKFPKILHWFSGNIGFHHIHHINARIPNYHLEKCYKDIPIFQQVKPVTFRISLKSLKLRLWDEKKQKLVAYS
ncbi:fatty acid desaturase [Sunxiuqinia sp. A32]|uniref:fatty acid desaturase n=1 Tax=Sunxiuqinia sp. A32 TaxID=3461496 RepID=UPI004046050C